MSLAAVLGRASLCSRAALAPARIHVPLGTATRAFSTTPVAQLRKEPKPRAPLSKKAQAAKARKRASKARKNIYENEKMPLADAISILRVRCLRSPRHTEHMWTHART
jgi:large subunit ribosomal protein L1